MFYNRVTFGSEKLRCLGSHSDYPGSHSDYPGSHSDYLGSHSDYLDSAMLKANFQFYCYCNVTYKFVYYKVTGC